MAKQIAYNMDCMEAMRHMPDKAFELAIVDPPYGGNDAKLDKVAQYIRIKGDGIELNV